MNKQEIEAEIQARVDFKIGELLTRIKNRSKFESRMGFDLLAPPKDNIRHMHYAEAFNVFVDLLNKEREMPVPAYNMRVIKLGRMKDIAVDKILHRLKDITRGRVSSSDERSIINTVVSAIEGAQELAIFDTCDNKLYEFKEKQYSIVCESRMKISELWIDVVIYMTEYDNLEGKYWVREGTIL